MTSRELKSTLFNSFGVRCSVQTIHEDMDFIIASMDSPVNANILNAINEKIDYDGLDYDSVVLSRPSTGINPSNFIVKFTPDEWGDVIANATHTNRYQVFRNNNPVRQVLEGVSPFDAIPYPEMRYSDWGYRGIMLDEATNCANCETTIEAHSQALYVDDNLYCEKCFKKLYKDCGCCGQMGSKKTNKDCEICERIV